MSPTYSVCADHGYLSGEQHTCPICGKPAEVYSRITGYYRPVQNWNDGKTQEFKDRKVYDLSKSEFHPHVQTEEHIEEVLKQEAEEGSKKLLFTTKTCPNCKIAKEFLKDEQYQVVDAEENPELSDAYGIMQAPTLVLVKDGEIRKFVNASNIKKYVDSRKK